jgi:hypothetical protein
VTRRAKKPAPRKPTQHKVDIHALTKEQTIALVAGSVMGGMMMSGLASSMGVNDAVQHAIDVAAMTYDRAHGAGTVHAPHHGHESATHAHGNDHELEDRAS